MLGLRRALERELVHLQRIKGKVDSTSKSTSNELVKVSLSKGKLRYYVKDSSGKYAYAKKQEINRVQDIVQAQYDASVYKKVSKLINHITQLLGEYSDNEIDNLYYNLHEGRRVLISPVETTLDQKFQAWLDQKYTGKGFEEGLSVIKAEKGERVRSKSEKIIADYLYHNGIEYKYEKPLFLKGYGTVYPDFTIWSPGLGREIYWEHFGKMDDVEYAEKALKKSISIYITESPHGSI